MPTKLITKEVWPTMTQAVEDGTAPAQVAVAYFAKGAAKRLPLPAGSLLVVDASERVVKQGLTHPADLERLRKRGVAIYSHPNLHAKVFVLGKVAFVGSANVSDTSANRLQEAVVRVKDKAIVDATRRFVRGLCSELLGQKELARLQKQYRPPKNAPGATPPTSKSIIRLAQVHELRRVPVELEKASDRGYADAQKRLSDKGSDITWFNWHGASPWKRGQRVVVVDSRKDGTRTVSPPGHVVLLRGWRRDKLRGTIVFVELPDRTWPKFDTLAKPLGSIARKRLSGNGLVRNPQLDARLRTYWR